MPFLPGPISGLPKNLHEGYSSSHGRGIRQTGGTGNCPAPRRARRAAVRLLPARPAAGGQRRRPAGELEPGRDLFDLIELKQALEAKLGRRVDVFTEKSLSPYIRAQVLREARSP